MVSGADVAAHFKIIGRDGDAPSSPFDVAGPRNATSRIDSGPEQAQSHTEDCDGEDVFQFLSGLDTSYSRRTRGHVLKKHQKRRREEAERRKRMSSGPASSAKDGFSTVGCKIYEPPHRLVKASPQSGFSAHRSDPFNTLSLPLTTREQFLADHYVNVLIPHFYAGSPRDAFNINKVALFPNAIHDSAAIAGALMFAAHHLILLRNGMLDTEFYYLRSRSIRVLNDLMSHPTQRISDVTIYAVLAQVAVGVEFEDWSGKAVSQVELASHIRALRLLIYARGGMGTFKGNRWLDWILNWIDLECAGEISAGLTSSIQSTLIASEVEAQRLEKITQPSYETIRSENSWLMIEELALIYENWYHLARRRTDAKSSALFDQSQLRRRLFADRSSAGRQPKLIRMAILIQLNLLVWDRRQLSPEEIKDSFKSIINVVSTKEMNVAGSTTHFLWTLITDRVTASINDHERLWATTRMLRIVNQCSCDLQRRLEMTLLCFLSSEDQSPVWSSWTPVRFTLDLFNGFSQRCRVE